MSAKNELQEYCQKGKLTLPIYKTNVVKGGPLKPSWISTVILDNKELITGEFQTTKIGAETSAAKCALKLLIIPQVIPQVSIYDIDPTTVILVDVENLPNLIDEILSTTNGATIYAFIGYHHCLANKTWKSPNVNKILSISTRADGSDTCMQVYTGHLLATQDFKKYLIATRDHFGSTLVEMITVQEGPWKSAEAHLVTQISHVIQKI